MQHEIRLDAEVELAQEQAVFDLIRRCALEALEAESAPEGCAVEVLIVDSETIREMNAEYRNKDAVTDVLSFPMCEFYNSEPQEEMDIQREPDSGLLLLGNMVLNYDRACEQAAEFGHSPERECGFLTVHSVLHLLGYDHERSEEERVLQREHEEAILAGLALTREDQV